MNFQWLQEEDPMLPAMNEEDNNVDSVAELILDAPQWDPSSTTLEEGHELFPTVEETTKHSTPFLERFETPKHLLLPDLECRTEGVKTPLTQYVFPLDRNDFHDLQWLLPLNVKWCSIVLETAGGKLVIVVMKSERCAGCLQKKIEFSCPTCQMVGFCSVKCWSGYLHPKASCNRLMEYSFFHDDRLNMLMEFGEAGCSIRLTNFLPRLRLL